MTVYGFFIASDNDKEHVNVLIQQISHAHTYMYLHNM